MKKIRNVFLLPAVLALTVSCDEVRGYDDYDPGQTPTVTMNGEWFIDIVDQGSGDVLAEHVLHKTYDAGFGNGQMYIDDEQNGYYIKGLVNTDLNNLTFYTSGVENLADPGSTFNITDGKILKNAARSRDGNVVDSIYFRAEFSYDPGTTIIFSGHKRTGFLEDEY